MADLEKMAELLHVNLGASTIGTKNIGKKRRPWLISTLQNSPSPSTENIINKKNQLDNIIDNNLGNTGNKLDNLGNRSDNELGFLANKIDNKSDIVLDNKLDNGLDNKTVLFLLSILNKTKERIFKYFLHICSTNGSFDTGPIPSHKIATDIGTPYNSFKTTLSRLINTKLISRNVGKTSPTGYINIHIFKNVKELAILQYGLDNKLGNKLDNRLDNKLGDSIDSSSGLLLNTTTTDIDIEPLDEIGFTIDHLNQILLQFKLPPKIIQDSIYAFAFDLKENEKKKKIKNDPISFFMGILRKQGGYLPPGNYMTPRERHMKEYRERIGELEARNAKIEQEALDVSFKNWFRKVPDAQKLNLLSEKMRKDLKLNGGMLEYSGRAYFTLGIWPKIKERVLSGEDVPEPSYIIDGEEAAKLRMLNFEQEKKTRTEEALKAMTGRK